MADDFQGVGVAVRAEPDGGAFVVLTGALDVSGLVLLWELVHGIAVPSVRAEVSGLAPEYEAVLGSYPPPEEVEAATAAPPEPPAVRDVVPGLAGSSGLTLDVTVEELCGDFSGPGQSAGVLSVAVTVYRGDPLPGAAPALRKVYSRREPLPKRTASAVVAGWDGALASIMTELGADVAAIPAGP